MVTATLTRSYSVEEAKALPDAVGYELIDGQLRERSMGAEAAEIEIEVGAELRAYGRRTRLIRVFGPSVALHLFPSRPRHFRRADASAVLRSRFEGGTAPREDLYIVPDLAVEVLSPTGNAYDADEKVADYLAVGVRLLWVVYPATRTVMVYRPGHSPLRLGLDDEVSGFDVLPGFSCFVRDFFPS